MDRQNVQVYTKLVQNVRGHVNVKITAPFSRKYYNFFDIAIEYNNLCV